MIQLLMIVLLLMLKLRKINVFVQKELFGNLGQFKTLMIKDKKEINLMNHLLYMTKNLESNILVIVVNHIYLYLLKKLDVQLLLIVNGAWNLNLKVENSYVLNVLINILLMLIQIHAQDVIKILNALLMVNVLNNLIYAQEN